MNVFPVCPLIGQQNRFQKENKHAATEIWNSWEPRCTMGADGVDEPLQIWTVMGAYG